MKHSSMVVKMFLLSMPMALSSCSEFMDDTDMLGGLAQVASASKNVNNVVILKLAYKDVLEKWAKEKKAFDMSLVKDEDSRKLVHNAAVTIDNFLNKIQSVRRGNTVEKALVIADIAFFKKEMAAAHADLSKVYELYGDNLSEVKKVRYKALLDNLEIVSLKQYPNIEESSALAKHLYDIFNAAKVIRTIAK